MKLLALDLSTKSSGQAIYENKELKEYGCITATSTNLYKRIDKMVQEIKNIIAVNGINKVAIEDVVPDDVRNNGTVFRALMHLQGCVCKMLSLDFNLTPEYLVASHQRKMCGIKTGAGVMRESLKPKDIAFVKNQFGLNVNDDIADAICIGFAVVGGEVKVSDTVVTDDGFEFG